MSWLSDITGGYAQDAADAQKQGLIVGEQQAQGYLGQNPGIINQYYGQAAAPYTQNYQTATGGVNQLNNLLGLGGAAGNASALQSLQNTPGYQFALGQGNNAVNAAAAANGTLNSGNQLTALANYDTGLANQTYQSAVQNLQPYLNLANQSAGGLSNVYQGQAAGLTGNNNILAQLAQGTAAGVGNAQANADLSKQASGQSLLGSALNLGSSLLGAGVGGGIMSGLSGLGGTLGNALQGATNSGVSNLVDNASLASGWGF